MTRMDRPDADLFEPRIADWLEDDAQHAPGQVLDTVLAAFPSIPQRRAQGTPWRSRQMNRYAALAAGIAAVAVVAVGGAFYLSSGTTPGVGGSSPSPSVAPSPTPIPSPSPSPEAIVDHSDVAGRVLVQHLGNALDGSEASATDGNYDRRRFYLMDPDGSNVTELLPGQPAGGKNHADISPDFTKVVFQDWADAPKVYEAGLDGSGLRILTDCDCIEGEPAYGPDGTRIAFLRQDGSVVTIGIRDLTSGAVTMLPSTAASWPDGSQGDQPAHPSWSPDGSSIVYARMHYASDGSLLWSQLTSVDVATGELAEIPVPRELRAGEPRWSPDGSLLLFASDSAETSLGRAYGNVYTIRADGTDLRNLTGSLPSLADGSQPRGAEGGTGASWTPDGRYIIYMHDEIRMMRADGSDDALWSQSGPDMSTNETGYGYTTYWIPGAP
jgi:Tol biopolymer transport system component